MFFLCLVTQPNLSEFVFVRMRFGHDNFNLIDEIQVKILQDHVYFLPYYAVK